MSEFIGFDSIHITSLTHPHDDLPMNMEIFALVTFDGTTLLTTPPVRREESQSSWKLNIRWVMRSRVSVKILHRGQSGDPELLCSVNIGRKEIINSLELNQGVFCLKLPVAIPGGPSLEFRAHFSCSDPPAAELPGIPDRVVIDEAISREKAEIQRMPDDYPRKPSRLSGLSNALHHRFEASGDLEDLNEAVSLAETAVLLTPIGHQRMCSHLTRLGKSLLGRFECLADLTDINQAIYVLGVAVEITSDDHPDLPESLESLGLSLYRRFERLGDLTDINQAISKCEAAVNLTPEDHEDRARYSNTAIQLTREDHSDMPRSLNGLGNAYLLRCVRVPDLSDVNCAVSTFESAIQLMPDGHPDLPRFLIDFGLSLEQRLPYLFDIHDYQKDQYICAACSPTGAAGLQFVAATMWANTALRFRHPSLLQAYTTAIHFLPKLAWLGLSISDRHHHILTGGKLVRDAASAAIGLNQLSTAIEWLEQGRSIIWGQILSLRTPVDDLRKSHPELADEFVSCSTALEAAGMKKADARHQPPLQVIAQDSHALADTRDKLLKQIRELAGFERFLLPKQIAELSLAALMGPVVLLNISEHRCDALILMAGLQDEIVHVPLPNFTLQDAQAMAKALASLILSALWMRIVRPVLDGLACPVVPTLEPGRIWWSPTGPLGFLPLHAAGIYGEDKGLGLPREKKGRRLQILAVAQPSAIGQSRIPGTLTELDSIQRLATIPVLRLDRDSATVDSVQDGMKKSLWAHFACHGVQDVSDPTNSAFLLAGSSRLTLSRIIELSLPDADLVFLSACQTATGSKNLEDESVHLTAGMPLAGYRGVIGTMWSIMDDDAPKVASDIYEHLFQTSPPGSTRAAEALHLAVGKLRDSDGAGGSKSFSRWVPFIHAGV
ncbi:CHAT domain-containing protein [Mycena galopus ATCC 62051]|nr:CHAT domain-containing protein [Mycena galopus ATCC 62051]